MNSQVTHDAGAPAAPTDAAVLLIHGFTGSRASMEPWARHLQAAGIPTLLPTLPGHETRWQDLAAVGYGQWIAATERAFDQLAAQHRQVFVAGLSMGGALALHLSTRRNTAGLMLVNPGLVIDSPVAPYARYLKRVRRTVAGISNDIALPDADELAYPRTPVAAVHQLYGLFAQTRRRLALVSGPIQLFRSTQDHVVADASVKALLAGLSPGVEVQRFDLPDSYHVATLDHDAPTIFSQSLRFINTHSTLREE